ncbi:TPA: tetratricopeptide repeat protein [Legionella pneumophila]|nr:sel1 repeat family protein [Legionella pneumophila]
MKLSVIKLFLLVIILFGINNTFASDQYTAITKNTDVENKFLPDELILENCLDKEIIHKISQLDLMFKQVASLNSPSNFKQTLLTFIDKNKLTNPEMNLLISRSKKTDLCGANANLALSFYHTALEIVEAKKENKLKNSSKYMEKALSIYRKYANQGSVGSIKLLCVPDHWIVESVDPLSKKTCLKAIYLKDINLSSVEKAKMFTAVYNAYWLPIQKYLPQRAELCLYFANDKNIMNYLNSMLKQRNIDMCNVEFIQYGEKLFSNKQYQDAFKYLSIFDQSSNKTGIPQFELGYMYQTGSGIPQNYSYAIDWYTKACANGSNPEAQYNLGIMYLNGHGVLQNYTIAHALYNMASANGLKDAGSIRDALAKKMTNEQIERAQVLANDWIKNWPKKLSI